jgi:hypothetical protein
MSATPTSTDSISLSYTDHKGNSLIFQLAPGKSVFAGVAKNCSLQLSGTDISPIHCRISFDGQSIKIFDWMSASGTIVDGQRIEGEVEVPAGCVLQLGSETVRILGGDDCYSQPGSGLGDSYKPSTERPYGENGSNGEVYHGSSQTGATAPCDLDETNPFGQDLTDDLTEDLTEDITVLLAEKLKELADLENAGDEQAVVEAVVEEEATVDVVEKEARQEIQDSAEGNTQVVAKENPWSDDAWTDDPAFADWIQDSTSETAFPHASGPLTQEEDPSLVASMESRIRDLLNEAEQGDRRIAVLEDLLLAGESAQAAQVEERQCLEAWLQDIERKFGEREAEHLAEVESMQRLFSERQAEVQQLQERLVTVGAAPDAHSEVMSTLEELRNTNLRLQEQLRASQERCRELEQQVAGAAGQQVEALRADLAELAQERAELARQRHELVNQLTHVSTVHQQASPEDKEMACRLRALREHLREIHQQEKSDRTETSFTSRLSNLWHRATR